MNMRTNAIIAVVMGLAISSQGCAESNERGNGNMPPPPNFTAVDTNSDNEISFAEFSQQDLPGGDAQTIFSEMDSDGDGVVSKAEFEAFKPPRPPRQ